MCCSAKSVESESAVATGVESNVVSPASDSKPTSEVTASDSVSAYAYVQEKFQPMIISREGGWTGQTYQEALSFCGTKTRDGRPLVLCDFSVYCPLGPEQGPYGGTVDESTSWAPVSNVHNWWVSVGTDSTTCMFFRSPEWGLSGVDNEEITRHIMCCNDVIGGGVSEEDTESSPVVVATDGSDSVDPYEYVEQVYQPAWFERGDGWAGQTYEEALAFCGTKTRDDEPLILCDFQAYCPLGSQQEPYSGSFSDPSGTSWAPISNDHNTWVSISTDNPCMLYSVMNEGRKPDWGMTGKDNEEITR